MAASPLGIMSLSPFVKAFCFLLIVHPKDGDAKEAEALLAGDAAPLPLYSWDWEPTGGPNAREGSGVAKGKREGMSHPAWLDNFHGPPSSLKDLAARVTEILDRISRSWALEGAKTIQSGEIRLRKLNKDVHDRIDELVANGSKYGRHVMQCMNRTIFEIGLDKILEDTTECYSKSLVAVQAELKMIEEEENAILERLENYGKDMFEMLSRCFLNDNAPGVIQCLQQVDGMNIGGKVEDRKVTDLMTEMARIINDIPRTFSECTSRSLLETEEHVRRGYAQSLTCLKDRD